MSVWWEKLQINLRNPVDAFLLDSRELRQNELFHFDINKKLQQSDIYSTEGLSPTLQLKWTFWALWEHRARKTFFFSDWLIQQQTVHLQVAHYPESHMFLQPKLLLTKVNHYWQKGKKICSAGCLKARSDQSFLHVFFLRHSDFLVIFQCRINQFFWRPFF